MRVIRITIYLIAFISTLIAGYNLGKKLNPLGNIYGNNDDRSISPGVAIPQNDQFNFLIIGVDNMERPDAHLESIWLVAHADNTNTISLIPIFPSTEKPEQNILLAGSFSLDDGSPSKGFWDVMKEKSFWWKGYLLSDINSSIQMVDTLGGVNFHGQQMNGEKAIASISPWENDPWIAVNHQKIFLESICNKVHSDEEISLKSVIQVMNQDFRYNKQTKIFLNELTSRISKNRKLTCNFPTLEKYPSTNR